MFLLSTGTLVQGRAIRGKKSDLIAKGKELLTHVDATIKDQEDKHNTKIVDILNREKAEVLKLVKGNLKYSDIELH